VGGARGQQGFSSAAKSTSLIFSFPGLRAFSHRQQLPPLLRLISGDDELRLDRRRLLREVRHQGPQRIHRAAKLVGELIERPERRVRGGQRELLFRGQMVELPEPKIRQKARQGGVVIELDLHQVDILEARLTIDAQAFAVLPEEAEAFAKEENRDQGEDDHRHQRVAPEKALDRIVQREPKQPVPSFVDSELSHGRLGT
jgi:hypothetical protein